MEKIYEANKDVLNNPNYIYIGKKLTSLERTMRTKPFAPNTPQNEKAGCCKNSRLFCVRELATSTLAERLS